MGTHRMIAASGMGEIQLIAAVERGKPERNGTGRHTTPVPGGRLGTDSEK